MSSLPSAATVSAPILHPPPELRVSALGALIKSSTWKQLDECCSVALLVVQKTSVQACYEHLGTLLGRGWAAFPGESKSHSQGTATSLQHDACMITQSNATLYSYL